MRLNRVGVLAVVHLCEKKEQLFNSFYAQTLSGSSPAQIKKEPLLRRSSPRKEALNYKPLKKKSRCCDSSFWCERRDLTHAAAVPCMLMARRPSQATVPGSPLLAKNSPPDCFFTLRPWVQAPLKIKKSRCCDVQSLGKKH